MLPRGSGAAACMALWLCSSSNREADKRAMQDKTGKGRGKITKGRKPSLHIVAEQPAEVVHLAKGQGKNAHGLTSKQEAFAVGVGSRGETLAQAYRAAYDTANMAQASIHAEACRLMANPLVAARVNALVVQRQAKASLDAARIKAHVIDRLHQESIDPDSTPAARVRALELLGRMGAVALFTPAQQADEATPAQADLAATLEARLKALLAKAG